MKTVLQFLEKFWGRRYWCAFDRGDREEPFPDTLYVEPEVGYKQGKEGWVFARIEPDAMPVGRLEVLIPNYLSRLERELEREKAAPSLPVLRA